jgi:hypothetical protein
MDRPGFERAIVANSRAAAACWRASAPLGVIAFWAGVWMAARRYPSEYDWHYMTLSSLLYPERDPHGYLWAWGGVVLCGLGGLGWTARMLRRRARPPGSALPFALRALGCGYLCMILCAVLPPRLLPVPKLHEVLALTAFFGLCIGMVGLSSTVLERRALRPLYTGLLASMVIWPVLLAGLTQAYLAVARPQLPWVGLAWRARGVPLYLSFALWQWSTCVLFSVYSTGLCLASRADAQRILRCIPGPGSSRRGQALEVASQGGRDRR